VRVRTKTPLSKKELAEFREMLLEKRRLLLGDLTGMEAEAAVEKGKGNLSTMPTHMADVGTDNFEHEFTLGPLESEQALLREIDEALARVEEGTYGICLGTREPIPKARLRAKPWAKYTVEYTRMLEKGLAQPAGEEERQLEDDEAEEPEPPEAPEPEEPEDEAPEEIEEEQE
jgi:RNA polymerase-binding transcription factor DksA